MTRSRVLAIILALVSISACRQDPPADWRSPVGVASPADCTACEHDRGAGRIDLSDGSASQKVDLIDDQQIIGTIESVATDMIDNKKCTVKAEEFAEQFKREKCSLELPKSPPTTAALSPAQVYERCRKSVLVVSGVYKCGKCSRWHSQPASGFALTADGVIVTNHHVLQKGNNETFVAMTADGRVFPVKEVLASSQRNDIAIARLDLPKGESLAPLPLQSDQPVGSSIAVISHPDRHFYALSLGIISRYHHLQRKPNEKAAIMAITADYARGSSGAPVLNDRGAVVGIVASTNSVYYKNENGKQENLQMVFKQCVPAASLLELIENVKK